MKEGSFCCTDLCKNSCFPGLTRWRVRQCLWCKVHPIENLILALISFDITSYYLHIPELHRKQQKVSSWISSCRLAYTTILLNPCACSQGSLSASLKFVTLNRKKSASNWWISMQKKNIWMVLHGNNFALSHYLYFFHLIQLLVWSMVRVCHTESGNRPSRAESYFFKSERSSSRHDKTTCIDQTSFRIDVLVPWRFLFF